METKGRASFHSTTNTRVVVVRKNIINYYHSSS